MPEDFEKVLKGLMDMADEYQSNIEGLDALGFWVVHGISRDSEGKASLHAWVENLDFVTHFGSWPGIQCKTVRPKKDFYAELNPAWIVRYKPSETMALLRISHHYGPWAVELLEHIDQDGFGVRDTMIETSLLLEKICFAFKRGFERRTKVEKL